MAEKIAGAHFEFKGEEYNWGDPVPQELVDQHPEWVVDKPLSAQDIQGMSKDDLQEALRDLYGHNNTETAEATVEAKKGGSK